MWSTGVLIQQKVKHKNKKSVHSFVAVPWANRAAKYLVIINKLSSHKWDEIRLLATSAINETKGEVSWADGDDTSEGPDPRTLIQLSSDKEDAEPAEVSDDLIRLPNQTLTHRARDPDLNS
jgi:hypothetical protein